MDDVITSVDAGTSEEVIPEVLADVSVTVSEPSGLVLPSASSVGQSMINAAVGIACGVVINAAVNGAATLGRKAFQAAKTSVNRQIENHKEKKLLKETKKQADATLAEKNVETEETTEE